MQSQNIHLPTAEVSDTCVLELLVGQDAHNLCTEDFLSKWDQLFNNCPWSTIFQSSSFVIAWYRTYALEYMPIIVIAKQNEYLTGLLCLALPFHSSPKSNSDNKRPLIMGAGMYEAEYQTWLAIPNTNDAFITEAFHMIRNRFPNRDILLRFLPPNVPLDWTKTNALWKRYVELQAVSRPIMKLQDPDVSKMFRKTEFRNKLNRLKRLGNLKFERITDFGVFASTLDELTVQFDFRQGAMFNMNQFRDNPLKSKFLLAMFEQDLLHVTVLKIEDEIVGSIVAVKSGDWVHLAGINIHSPFYASASPGFVHFLLLGQHLAAEGTAMFDLTPGGDSYKERMANEHDTVHELVVSSSMPYRIKRLARKKLHELLIKAGKRPMSVELSLRKRLYLLKGRVLALKEVDNLTTLRMLLRPKNKIDKTRTFSIRTDAAPLSDPIPVSKNNLQDLLSFEKNGGFLTRWEFLESAMVRFENGEQSYTWSENGLLLGCAWLCKAGAYKGEASIPADAPVLHDITYHPTAKSRLKQFIESVTQRVIANSSIPIFVVSNANDRTLCRALEQTAILLQV